MPIRYLIYKNDNAIMESEPLDKDFYLIGRDEDCHLQLSNSNISRQHASLSIMAGKLILSDFNSTNGTFVNGVSIDKTEIFSGDRLQFGSFECWLQNGPVQKSIHKPPALAIYKPVSHSDGETVSFSSVNAKLEAAICGLLPDATAKTGPWDILAKIFCQSNETDTICQTISQPFTYSMLQFTGRNNHNLIYSFPFEALSTAKSKHFQEWYKDLSRADKGVLLIPLSGEPLTGLFLEWNSCISKWEAFPTQVFEIINEEHTVAAENPNTDINTTQPT
jgi:hypothetical protein